MRINEEYLTPESRGTMAATVAAAVIQAGCCQIRHVDGGPDAPLIFTSKWASPLYCDMRRLLGSVHRYTVIEGMARLFCAVHNPPLSDQFPAMAGGETAGIAYSALLAARFDLPVGYVRKQPKGHGTGKLVEGLDAYYEAGGRAVALVEDIVTDGASKIAFANALRDWREGVTCTDVFVPVAYGAFPGTTETLGDAGLELHACCTWKELLLAGEVLGAFTPDQVRQGQGFLADPVAWSAAHGGRAA